MAHPFRFGIQLTGFTTTADLKDLAVKVEDLGYAELFSSDHIAGGGLTNLDPFLPLLSAAEATTTLRFGPLVLNNEFHNPALLARTAASFDLLTDGRLILGLGTGYMQEEHDAADIPLRAPGPRVTRFGESVSALRSLLDTGAVHCQGEHITMSIEDLGSRPAQAPVPILIGGHGKRVVSIAARKADIFQFTGLTHDPKTGKPSPGGFDRSSVATRHRWLAEAAGDRYATLEISSLVQQTTVGDGAATASSAVADRLGTDPSIIDDTPFLLIGSVDQVAEKLHRLRDDFGIHHIVSRDPEDLAPVVAALAGT